MTGAPRDHRRGTEALARLGQRTSALHDHFAQAGVEFKSYRRGMLVVAERRESAESFLRADGADRRAESALRCCCSTRTSASARSPIASGSLGRWSSVAPTTAWIFDRIESIVRAAAPLLPGLDLEHRTNLWTGMRPIAPDGLPVIDRVPGSANVYVASGYSMLGMTLAGPAGEALAEMVRSGRRPPVLEPLRIDRFKTARRLVSRRRASAQR